jgi:hypothetical protein
MLRYSSRIKPTRPAAGNVIYWKKGEAIQNFGDYLSEYFTSHLFYGPPVIYHAMHLVGSVIADAYVAPGDSSRQLSSADAHNSRERRVVFWGCGLRSPDSLSASLRPAAEFLAVRGPMTRAVLGLPRSIPTADPALLLPAIYRPIVSKAHLAKTLCIPHFHDRRTDDEICQISGCTTVVRPNIPPELGAIERIIDAIASADFTLSASLHGAIVAAAYGKKFAFWDSGTTDVPFKWEDFAESVSLSANFATTIGQGMETYEREIRSRISLPALWPLLAVAPFPVRPSAFAHVIFMDVQRHGEGVLDVPVDLDTIERLLYATARSNFSEDPVVRAYFSRRASVSSAKAIRRRVSWLASTVRTWLRGAL